MNDIVLAYDFEGTLRYVTTADRLRSLVLDSDWNYVRVPAQMPLIKHNEWNWEFGIPELSWYCEGEE